MKTFAFIPSPENYMSVNVLDWHLPLSIFTRRKMQKDTMILYTYDDI